VFMVTLGFFSLTTDERLQKKWTRGDIKALRKLLQEAVYMREGSTTLPPEGFSEDDVRELRTILDYSAQTNHGECSYATLAQVKEYFEGEISICATLV
jgi:hypothetical protein